MYLSNKQLAERYSVNRATIWRWRKTRNFPAPVQLGPNTTRWRTVDVEAWEAAF